MKEEENKLQNQPLKVFLLLFYIFILFSLFVVVVIKENIRQQKTIGKMLWCIFCFWG